MREALVSTATEAVETGGAVLASEFDGATTTVEADFRATDVKAAADVAAEERMLPVIRDAFPDHAIYAEESGVHSGDADYRWIVDPLDGTNDFAAGLPTFASAVAVTHRDEPVVAAAHLPVTGETYVAARGEGVRYDGERVVAASDRPLAAASVVSVVGHEVATDESLRARADDLYRAIEAACKRRVESWSPTVHWGLLARGRLDGVVAFHPDEEEQYLGELFVAESGMVSREVGKTYIAAANEDLLSGLIDALPGGSQ